MIAQQTLNGLVLGGVYALFALGFTLIFGIHRIMNMAHGAVFMAGAFVGLYTVRPACRSGWRCRWPWWVPGWCRSSSR
jgi:branched-subunit amino acid ABC-type transport system permease component